ncbi:MAG: FAD-binding oxidoreductase [Tepidisphaeraceae bacterium]|jgi:ferredoxin-NADP reductase/uncharacterized protein YcbX
MAYLSRIFLYPIKSLDGIAVDSAPVLSSGALADDRRFAIFDALNQYVNGKRNPRIHLLRSIYCPVTSTLKLAAPGHSPKTFHVFSQRRQLQEWLSEFLGFPASFRENIDLGFPDDTDSPGPTLISTATLHAIADWFNLTLDQTRARFRTNLEIDGVPPFWEDRLYGVRGVTVRFSVGPIVFDGINPCQRCVVPARDPITGQYLPNFAKRFVELRRKYLPDWAEPSRFNHFYRVAINTRLFGPKPSHPLKIGDPITILGPAGAPENPAKTAAAQPQRWTGQLRVARIFDSAPGVRTFRLCSLDSDNLPFTFLPGQYLNLELIIDGKTRRRCYTIASSPTRPTYCELTIKRDETGLVSRYLHDQLQEGMTLNVSGPGGRFTFTGDEADSLLLVGAGVGITPLISKIRYLTDRKWPGSIHLIYSAKSQRDILFKEELDSLSRSFPNLKITTTLTREPDKNWPGQRGRIGLHQLQPALQTSKTRRVHICGPIEMAADITQLLKEAGVPHDQIRSEAFGGPPLAPTPTPSNKSAPIIGTVTFADAGKSSPLHAGQTVLEIAGRLGVNIDRGCMEGICGRCKVKLLSGEVKMDATEGLAPTDQRNGYILACQAKPLCSVAIEA